MDIVLMLFGFGLLVIGGEFLVRASVALSFKLNISKMVIGLTVVSFATSLPRTFSQFKCRFKWISINCNQQCYWI